MKLSIGIVGLPNVGKSTLFKALTKKDVNIANYPFATIDPSVGVVSVPDERVDKLAELSGSEKRIPAVVEFYDIAGLVKGANRGEGLGNQFLAHIREVAVIVHVVRCFGSDDIVHVEEGVDPARDIDIVNTELILKDMETVDRRIDRLEKESKTGDKEKVKDLEILRMVRDSLDNGILVYSADPELAGASAVKELSLLTLKPQIYLLNGDESDVSDIVKDKIKELGSDYIVANLGKDSAVGMLVKRAYKILGLISFFTTGDKETRAWTIRRGAKAPEAAGVIHTDFERNFIRCETVYWEKLLETGGWQKARQRGLIRVEGKEYVMEDGDVVEIRHG